MRSLPPKSDTEPEPHGPTDLQSLLSCGLDEHPHQKPPVATDFGTLKHQLASQRKRLVKRTATDYVIDGLTPLMIFVMIYSVLRFLLDVRYIYLELSVGDQYAQMYEGTLRSTAFFFVMGAVALNRLIARDGKEESVLYTISMIGVVGLYTFCTTDQTGSLTHSFLNQPYVATVFNMALVGFIWWVINRLTHECCVDSNPTAGEIGFLTGTARRIQKALGQSEQAQKERRQRKDSPYLEINPLDAVDPTEWEKPEAVVKQDYVTSETRRLPKRHPGISVFYLSVLVMFVFALGQRVLLNGDAGDMLRAHINLALYTGSALAVLMLSSLAGLRSYFQEKGTVVPEGIGVFWVGLGTFMIVFVMLGAMKMPMPNLPMRSLLARELAEQNPPPDAEASNAPGHIQGGEKGKAGDADAARRVQQPGKEGQEPGSGKATDKDGQQQGEGKQGEGKEAGDAKGGGQAESARASSPPPITTRLSLPDQSGIVDLLGKATMVVLGVFVAIGILRALAALAFALAHKSRHTHQLLARLFGWVDRFLQRVTRLPSLPRFRRRRHVDREVSLAARFSNPLRTGAHMSPKEMVEYSYSALCALAEDLAVPRLKDQTPFEYIRSFPPILDTLRDEAVILTNLYVVSAYSNLALDEQNLDTLRRFWQSYEVVRSTVVR